jgi:APA family basic amino acid/polyamine antiporter
MTGPRVAFAKARGNQLPAMLGRLSSRGQTPAVATAAVSAAALIMLWSGSFDRIVLLSGVGLSLLSLATIAAVYVLRRTQPALPRPFRVPGYPLVPALYLAITAAMIIAAFIEEPLVSALAVLVVLTGLPLFELIRWAGSRGPRCSSHTYGPEPE